MCKRLNKKYFFSKMYKTIVIISILLVNYCVVIAQYVSIGDSATYNDALVSVNSKNKGFLPPRLTLAQRQAIPKPAIGLTIWCIDFNELQIYNGFMWTNSSGSSAGQIPSKAVKICFTTWVEKNLDVRTYRNGDSIPVVTDPVQWSNLTTGAMCWYNNDSTANNTTYGPLYNWYAVNDSRGLAPLGCHIAKAADWGYLSNCLNGDAIAGGKMKDTGNLWVAPNVGASNTSGFTALPGGYRNSSGVFEKINEQATWWVKEEINATTAPIKLIEFTSSSLTNQTLNKNTGVSVRCVVLDN
jgi:uncharacterized protein (TIGR02145 family)